MVGCRIFFGLESIQEEPADVAAFARVHRTLRLLQPSREIAADAVETPPPIGKRRAQVVYSKH